jgi:hypothetical protein
MRQGWTAIVAKSGRKGGAVLIVAGRLPRVFQLASRAHVVSHEEIMMRIELLAPSQQANRPMSTKRPLLAPIGEIARRIIVVRGQKVMIDADLAELYGAPTKRLNETSWCAATAIYSPIFSSVSRLPSVRRWSKIATTSPS